MYNCRPSIRLVGNWKNQYGLIYNKLNYNRGCRIDRVSAWNSNRRSGSCRSIRGLKHSVNEKIVIRWGSWERCSGCACVRGECCSGNSKRRTCTCPGSYCGSKPSSSNKRFCNRPLLSPLFLSLLDAGRFNRGTANQLIEQLHCTKLEQ
jgi:hypothetical protein